MTDQDLGTLYEGLQRRLHYPLGYSPWMAAWSPGLLGSSSSLVMPVGPSLAPAGWDWDWSRAWRWGLSYVPLCMLGIGLWAAPLAGQPVATMPPCADQSAQVEVTDAEATSVVEALVPVRHRAEVRMDAACAVMRRKSPAKEKPQDAQEEAGRGIVLAAQWVHATLPNEEPPTAKPKVRKKQNRPGPDAEIADGVFTDEQVKGLVDGWLIPLLVDSLVRERLSKGKEE